MRLRYRIPATVGVAVTVLGLAACGSHPVAASTGAGSTSSSGAGGTNVTTLRVAALPITPQIPLQIAQQEGYFKQEGLKVKAVTATAFDATLASVLNGSVDIGFGASVPLLFALAKNAPVQVVGQTASITGGDASKSGAFVDVVNPAITSPKDLVGKKVGVVSLNDLGSVGIRTLVAKDGGDPANVKFVTIPQAQLLGALLAGRVQAITLNEPLASVAQANPKVHVLASYTAALPVGAPLDMYFAKQTFLKANPQTLVKFRAALAKAVTYANAHPKQVRSIARGMWQHIPAKDAANAVLETYSSTTSKKALGGLEDALTRYGGLTGKTGPQRFYSFPTGS